MWVTDTNLIGGKVSCHQDNSSSKLMNTLMVPKPNDYPIDALKELFTEVRRITSYNISPIHSLQVSWQIFPIYPLWVVRLPYPLQVSWQIFPIHPLWVVRLPYPWQVAWFMPLPPTSIYLRCEENRPLICPLPSHPIVGHLSVDIDLLVNNL